MRDKGKRGKVKANASRTTPHIGDPGSNAPAHLSTDHQHPTFSFKHVDLNNYLLQEWEKDELKQFVKQLRMMEGMTWLDVKRHSGLRWKTLDVATLKCSVPDYIPEEQTLAEFRVSGEMRIMGYREGAIFCIVWFDRGHDVTG